MHASVHYLNEWFGIYIFRIGDVVPFGTGEPENDSHADGKHNVLELREESKGVGER